MDEPKKSVKESDTAFEMVVNEGVRSKLDGTYRVWCHMPVEGFGIGARVSTQNFSATPSRFLLHVASGRLAVALS